MPVRFAAARSIARSPLARAFVKTAVARPANDNGDEVSAFRFDDRMTAALRHFAEHGLGAAEAASRNAEQAHGAGDVVNCRYWLNLCRALDPRQAQMLEHQFGSGSSLIY